MKKTILTILKMDDLSVEQKAEILMTFIKVPENFTPSGGGYMNPTHQCTRCGQLLGNWTHVCSGYVTMC